LRGNIEAADALLESIAPLRSLLGREEDAAFPHYDRSLVEWCRENYALAFDEAMKGVAAADVVAFLGAWIASQAAFAMRDPAAARRVVDAADGAPDRGRYTAALRRYMHGGLAMLEGRVDEGVREILEAARYIRECEVRLDLAQVLLGLVLLAPPDHPSVPEAAREARTIIEELGARAMGDVLDRVAPPLESAVAVA
jgi:hypothetical protein